MFVCVCVCVLWMEVTVYVFKTARGLSTFQVFFIVIGMLCVYVCACICLHVCVCQQVFSLIVTAADTKHGDIDK